MYSLPAGKFSQLSKILLFSFFALLGIIFINSNYINLKKTATNFQALASGNTVVQDSFTRTSSNGWGTADIGGIYSYSPSTATADFKVNGNEGSITVPTANSQRIAALQSPIVRDVDAKIKVKTDKTTSGGIIFTALTTRAGVNGNYRVVLRFQGTSVYVLAQKYLSSTGTTTDLTPQQQIAGLSHNANTYYWVRGLISGVNPTTIYIKAWQDGQAEPGIWQYTISDNDASQLINAGYVEIISRVTSGNTNIPVVFSYDNYLVADAAVVPSPTPTNPKKAVTWHLGKWYVNNAYNWNGIRKDFDDMKNAGITWMRTSIVQQTGTNAFTSLYDPMLAELQARNIKWLITINKDSHDYNRTTEQAAWTAWVGQIVDHYKTKGVTHYEIHNEPNYKYFWNIPSDNPSDPAYKPAVQRYINLLADAYTTIKLRDPQAQVVMGGLSQLGFEPFVDEMIFLNAYQYFDSIGFHPYSDTGPNGVITHLNNLKAKMATQPGFATKPIWINELGYTSSYGVYPGEVGHVSGCGTNKSACEQVVANYLTQTWNLLRDNGITLPITWYVFTEFVGDTSDLGRGLILVDKNNLQTSLKPAYYSYQNLWSTTATPTSPPQSPTPTFTQFPTNTPIPPTKTVITSSFIASADTYVRSDVKTKNYGSSTILAVDGSPIKIAYLKFNLTSLAGKTITAAKLWIKVANNTSNTVQNVKAVSNSSWAETTTNYNNKPPLGGIVGTFLANTAYTLKQVDITAYVTSFAGQLVSLGIDTVGSSGSNFSSRESVAKPYLEITYF